MRTAVPLHEFMPYGAPDLIESRRRHMSRALLLASASALAVYALTTSLAALMPRAQVTLKPMIIVDPKVWEPIVPKLQPPAPAIARPRPPASKLAPPLPVPDPLAPRVEPTTPGIDQTIGRPGEQPVFSDPSLTETKTEPLPGRHDWVYVEELPKPIKQVKPDYPELPLQAGIEGAVTVFVLVGTDGHVLQAELSEKIQVPMLNEAALAAARQWVFRPGYANGNPVACWTAIPFRFRLH